ncbi:MAG: mechanosensitive ion channel [Proteobacteria bacterium]|nr:mechanosensitive ion channel [Pseudomonadota bacterium]
MEVFLSNFIHIWLPKIIFTVIVFALAYLTVYITEKIIRGSVKHANTRKMKPKQFVTITHLFSDIAKITIYFFATVIVLNKFGINTSAIVASAGVLGLAVGFGAQELVKNVISGLFIIMEGMYYIGDVIEIDGTVGTCEKINLHNTYIRDFTGKVYIIPNGDIRKVVNMNRDFLRVIVKVGIGYNDDVDEAMNVMNEIIKKYADEIKGKYLGESSVQGVTELGDSAVYIRGIIKVSPDVYWGSIRELNKRVLSAFRKEGINIPYNTQTVYLTKEQ